MTKGQAVTREPVKAETAKKLFQLVDNVTYQAKFHDIMFQGNIIFFFSKLKNTA